MTDAQERRDPATGRMPVSTLVEVCGNIPGTPVFEAESVDVSPRGMHLRTAYLPEDGAPLVCRFESEGREIVVEGVVAWRREAGRGGEFGVKFTALDSRSVDALRHLCRAEADKEALGEGAEGRVGEPGSRVRLHIEGLGSPMKARVKTGGSGRVQVGSSLEFLKVGRRLEIEDLEQGGRRSAEIDGVSVLVDPSTQVPQLVVALRFEGAEDSTPSPSVADLGTKDRVAPALRIPASAVSTDAGPTTSTKAAANTAKAPASGAAASDASDDDPDPEMRGRVASLAASAEKQAIRAGEKLAQASGVAAKNASAWFKSAAGKIGELRRSGKPVRRTTSPAPGNFTSEKPRLRPQSGPTAGTAADAPSRRFSRRNVGIASGVVVLGTSALVFALSGPSAAPPGASASGEAVSRAAAPDASSSAPAPGPAKNVAGDGSPNGAVTANVPLFGPTPLTTTEPAPLGPPPGSEAKSLEDSEKAEAKASLGSRAEDESFSEESESASDKKDKGEKAGKSSIKPEDVKAWGHGRMHEPVIHRLRLDGAGAALQGAVEPTGFTVVIPTRKVMETPSAISKRDARVARVKVTNSGNGAQVSFRFRESVPSYRVRLRRDYVEFLISSDSVDDAESKTTKRKASSDSKSAPRER